jgi:hypothetical protein
MKNQKHELKFLELVRQKYYTVFKNGEIYKTLCWYCKAECLKKVVFTITESGYCMVDFRYNGKQCKAYVHRVVYTFFKGEIPDGMYVNHIDGNPGNNALSNLEAVTPRENLKHAVHVTKTNKSYGTTHHNAKLKPVDIAKILYFHHHGTYSNKQLEAMFGVHRTHIVKIYKLRAWRCLFDEKYLLSETKE